jgi:hypothetical protein
MTKKSKYKMLCEAYEQGVESCNEYRKECREFIQDLRGCIIEHLGCPETKLFMYQPTKGFIFKSHIIQGDSYDTEFGDKGTALIGFALNVNDAAIENKFFTFLVVLKRIEDKMIFGILDEDKDFDATPEGSSEFCEYLFEVSQKSLQGRLENFLESPEEKAAPIGFKVKQAEN